MNVEQVIEFIQSASPSEKTQIRKALASTKVKKPLNLKTLKARVSEEFEYGCPSYNGPTWQERMKMDISQDLLKDFEGLCEKLDVSKDLTLPQATSKIVKYINGIVAKTIKKTEEDFVGKNKSNIGVRYNPETDRYESFYQ
jgi:hypothetical protein